MLNLGCCVWKALQKDRRTMASISFLSSSIILNHKNQFSKNICKFPPGLQSTRKLSHQFPHCAAPEVSQRWKLWAKRDNLFLLDTTPVEDNAQELVSTTSDEGGSSIISLLLLVAFVGISILTIGVVYIAVTDFLQKREKEKFEKEEAAKKKGNGKKGKIRSRARAGPRGFGQKIEEETDDVTD